MALKGKHPSLPFRGRLPSFPSPATLLSATEGAQASFRQEAPPNRFVTKSYQTKQRKAAPAYCRAAFSCLMSIA